MRDERVPRTRLTVDERASCAEEMACPECDDPVGTVSHRNRHPISLADVIFFPKYTRQPRGTVVCLVIREALILKDNIRFRSVVLDAVQPERYQRLGNMFEGGNDGAVNEDALCLE